MMSRLKLDVPGPIRAGCNIWVLLLEDRNLEMVLKGRPWSDFSGRITYGLADLRGDAFGGVTAGALLLPQAMGYGIILGLGPVAGPLWSHRGVPLCRSVRRYPRHDRRYQHVRDRHHDRHGGQTHRQPGRPLRRGRAVETTSPNCTAGRKSPASRSPAGWPTILNYWRSATPCW